MKEHLKVIGFDADDTLWVNETYYRDTEKDFVKLLQMFASEETVMHTLMATEIKNLPLYGYGAKYFICLALRLQRFYYFCSIKQ